MPKAVTKSTALYRQALDRLQAIINDPSTPTRLVVQAVGQIAMHEIAIRRLDFEQKKWKQELKQASVQVLIQQQNVKPVLDYIDVMNTIPDSPWSLPEECIIEDKPNKS